MPPVDKRVQVPPNCDLTLGIVCTDKSEPGRTVWRMLADERFATLQLALLCQVESGAVDVHLASAAHPPAIVLRADGSTETATGGSIVGVWQDAEVGEARFTLEPGETLLTYTDGWLEAGPVERHRSPEDLARAVAAGREEDLGALVDRLRRDAVERGGIDLRDDLVLFALRPTGAREPARA